MRNLNRTIYLTFLIAFLFTGCKKDSNKAVTGPYLYLAGQNEDGNSPLGATYWKSSLSLKTGNFTSQVIANWPRIYSISTEGTDFYAATQTNGYWKNNVFIPVTGSSSIYLITVSGNDVYTAGTDSLKYIAYWKNNTETRLTQTLTFGDGNISQAINSIALLGSNVLLSGTLLNQSDGPPTGLYYKSALLWTNNSLQYLAKGTYLLSPDYTSTIGIAVSGNDVYVLGTAPDGTQAGGYWKNGVWNAINNGAFVPTAIKAVGADVYITGYIQRSPTVAEQEGYYWKNGTLTSVPNSETATNIAINGSDVYVLGIADFTENNTVWKNGTVYATIGNVNFKAITQMAIGN